MNIDVTIRDFESLSFESSPSLQGSDLPLAFHSRHGVYIMIDHVNHKVRCFDLCILMHIDAY